VETTLGEAWESYRKKVVPPTATSAQVYECRRAFYAGAIAAMTLQIGVIADAVKQTTPAIDRLRNECADAYGI
jgi:hypothetical protein